MWRGPIHPGTEPRGPRAGRPPRLRAALVPVILFLIQPVTAPAQTGTRVKVRIEGVEGVLERNVRAVMEIARAAENGPMPRARAGQLHNRAEQDIGVALEPFGYYRPGVEKSLKQEGDELVARYVIDPGPVVRLRTVSVELSGPAADAPAFREAAAAFPLRAGDTLRHVPYEAGKLLLLQVASDSGYLDADFDTSVVHVDRDRGSADITVRFRTGPRFRFGPVTFEQDILDPEFLRTRVPFRPGDPWQQHRLLELQTALAEDPYFARVEVLPRREAAEVIEEGHYKAYGQDLTIENGTVRFAGGPVDNPGLSIRATRVADDSVVAGIAMSGSLKEPEISLFSDPPMSQSQVLSYITTGQAIGQGSGSGGNLIDKALSALGVKGGNLIAKAVGQEVGLDEAKIETEGDLQEASLVVGRYLSPSLYITYGIGLFDPVSTLRLRYVLSNRFTLEAETGGQGTSADALVKVRRRR